LITVLVAVAAPADSRTAQVVFVPWKVVNHEDPGTAGALVLYWIPSSPDELRRSELVTSRALAAYAARCVGMLVIRADDSERIEKLGAAGELPVALLMDGEEQVGRVDNESGSLDPDAVAHMVREAFDRRELKALERTSEGKRLAQEGDREAAVAMYQLVAEERCAFPRLAKDAQRALKKLGVK
jgi:hypothetical protein